MGPGALARRPKLAILVSSVVETWAMIDADLVRLLRAFLKADFIVTAAMLQALTGADGKRAAINAAAQEALPEEDLKLYRAVMKFIAPSRNRRNEFVHHIWGYSPELRGALLLQDPRYAVMTGAIIHDIYALVQATKPTKANPLLLDRRKAHKLIDAGSRSRVYVFSQKDLRQEKALAKECLTCVWRLYQTCLGEKEADRARQMLLAKPPIQQALAQLSSGSNPKAPPESPKRAPPERPKSPRRRSPRRPVG
jgi:hypothetical protein